MRAYTHTNMLNLAQLCHAYRRWNDIGIVIFLIGNKLLLKISQSLDLARNIYYNVTIEKINFLNLLFDHEKKSELHLQDLILQSEVRSIPFFRD
jgi:hypothetical protein